MSLQWSPLQCPSSRIPSRLPTGTFVFFITSRRPFSNQRWKVVFETNWIIKFLILNRRSIYALQVPIVMASRIPQIITLFSEKKTGVLSFIAVFLNFAGTAVRSLTSFMIWQKSNFGTDQAWIFGNFAVCLTLNSIILAQWCYYGEDGNGYLCLRRDAKKAKKKKQ